MQAVILADRLGHELTPITEDTCVAMLDLAGKPLLQYTIEDCVAAGIKEIFIVVSRFPEQIRNHFEDGKFWNVKFHYCYSRGEENPNVILNRFKTQLRLPFALMRGDVFRNTNRLDFFNPDTSPKEEDLSSASKAPFGVVRFDNWHSDASTTVWQQSAIPEPHFVQRTKCESNDSDSALKNIVEFHQTSIAIVSAANARFNVARGMEKARYKLGPLSTIHTTAAVSDSSVLGQHVEVKGDVVLEGTNIIGTDCIIDAGAKVKNSIIMPGTYVGRNLSVENAVVHKQNLIRIDRNTAVSILDPVLLGETSKSALKLICSISDRAIAMFLLILSVPVWPIALMSSLLSDKKGIVETVPILHNRSNAIADLEKPEECWLFTSRIPVLRSLPLLLLVISGRLRLFGLPPKYSEPQSLMYKSDQFGIFGPAQLLGKKEPTEVEINLATREFVNRTGFKTFTERLCALFAYLCSSRAWRGRSVAGSGYHDYA